MSAQSEETKQCESSAETQCEQSLEKACETFNTNTKKTKAEEHGKVTEKYIKYCITDVIATYEVFERVIEELGKYEIDIDPTKVYSSASFAWE